VREPLELISDLLSCPYVRIETFDYTFPGADCKLVTLVAIIFRVSHKVTVKGSLTIPRTDVGRTHSGSLEGKSTITAWKLAPRCKSINQVTNVTDPPALSMPLPIFISQCCISSPTSGFIVGMFFFIVCFSDL
jgi:hypothetical protein